MIMVVVMMMIIHDHGGDDDHGDDNDDHIGGTISCFTSASIPPPHTIAFLHSDSLYPLNDNSID